MTVRHPLRTDSEYLAGGEGPVASTLEIVQRSQGAVLAAGEQFLAAAFVERRTGFFGGIPVVLA